MSHWRSRVSTGLAVAAAHLCVGQASADEPDAGAAVAPAPASTTKAAPATTNVPADSPPVDADADAVTPVPPTAPRSRGALSARQAGDQTDYVTRHYEPAGFPLIGGDSDVGFEFGAAGTLSYFGDGAKPYLWNMDMLVSLSVKQGPSGPEIAQQNYLWQLDLPNLLDGNLRLNPEVAYNHTINYGYFGLGNASSAAPPPASNPNPGRFYEWIDSFVQVRTAARWRIEGPLSALVAVQYLHVSPTAYAGSLLAQNAAARNPDGSPLIHGTTALSLPSLATGFVYDSRDSEVFPRKGVFHDLGVRVEQGIPFDGGVRYVEAGAILRGFVPVVGPLVAAFRFVANFQFGDVPFDDLFQAGPFDQQEMPGGSAGIRGVPVGRYLGPIKMIGNFELRAMLFRFSVLKQRFSIGNDAFVDSGRVWSNYSFHSPLDGSGAGLKYGVGGGIYVLWGQAAMLRIEAAYSPDAVSENPTLPVGIYVNDNTMF